MMKHTDFFAQTRAIKEQEYEELYSAVQAHGGIYTWDLSEENYPVIAANINSLYPSPQDINIYKVSIENGILKIWSKDKEYGNEVKLKPEDAFAGHLSSIIDYIPATDNVKDVTSLQGLTEQAYVGAEKRNINNENIN